MHGLSVKAASSTVYSAAFDVEKNTYLAGNITDALSNIDTFALYNNSPSPIFKPKTFLAKLDSTGKCLFLKQSWNGSGGISSVKLYRNSLYLYGVVDSCFRFDTATICNTSPNGSGFLAKTDIDGNILWVRNYFPVRSAFFTGISLDNKGNCYLSGWSDSTVTISGYTLQKTAGSNRNTFLVKYDSTGVVIWAKQISCTGDMLALGINTDEDGKTYITGNFSGTAIFGNDTFTATNNGGMYVTRFDNAGNCLGAKTVAGANSKSIAQDATGNAIVTGDINTGTVYFDAIPLNASGSSNFFLAKLSAITGPTSTNRLLEDNRLTIYPNPNNQNFTIVVPEALVHGSTAHLSILDNSGRVIKEEDTDISGNRVNTDIGTVQKGMYTVILSHGHKKFTGRVVVE